MSEENKKKELLEVKNLNVRYKSGQATVYAVNGISLELEKGQTLGLVGETGAGKTTIAKSILRILPDYAIETLEGKIYYEGKDILKLSDKELQNLRGHEISMIFQDPMTALNPVKTVSSQIAEGYRKHHGCPRAEANRKAVEMLEMVGIPGERADEYPHQFSGGMKQRVVIAMAMACSPKLLIADEPTTALDVTIQAQVLDLIKNVKEEIGTAMLLITHDLGVVAEVCDKVCVIYAGRIVESGSKEDIFDKPSHPYTRGLFAALPDLDKDVERLTPIEGLLPDPTVREDGCAFRSRCPHACHACREFDNELRELAPGHYTRCWRGLQDRED